MVEHVDFVTCVAVESDDQDEHVHHLEISFFFASRPLKKATVKFSISNFRYTVMIWIYTMVGMKCADVSSLWWLRSLLAS